MFDIMDDICEAFELQLASIKLSAAAPAAAAAAQQPAVPSSSSCAGGASQQEGFAASPRTGLFARRGPSSMHWDASHVRLSNQSATSHAGPQPWLERTSAPDIDPADRRRLDFVLNGATSLWRGVVL